MVFNLLQLIKNLVPDTFTFWLFSINFKFQVNSLFLTSSRDSVTIGKSSAFRNSQGQPLRKSQENASKEIKIHKSLKQNAGKQQYVVVIARCRVQYGKYFLSFSYFTTYSKI